MTTQITTFVTPYTTTPSRQSPATFSADRDTRLQEEATRIPQQNSMATEMNAVAIEVNSNLVLAENQVDLATEQAELAAASAATAMSAANYKGPWSSQTGAANLPYAVSHNGYYWQLTSNLADVSSKTPGTDSEWQQIGILSNIVEDTTPQLGGNLDPQGYSTNWSQVPTANFTATPASTSTITMTEDMTAKILAGMSLKYVIGGTTYYGRVSAIAAGLLTVNGAPLGADVTALYYGGGTIREVVVIIPGKYEDASNTALIASDLKSQLIWKLPKSYLVNYSVFSKTHDTGTHGQASVRINDTEVNTTAGGLTIAADATWYSTVVDIATAAYDVNPGEAVEVTVVKAGNGDAADLTVIMVFVTA